MTESNGSDVPTVINYAQDTANIGSFNPNNLIPGMGTHTDNIGMEVVTYLQLNRGAYRFGVAKDDGCRVTAGPVSANTNLVLGLSPSNGEFTFDFLVETNGLYPFRLVYYEGSGGAGVEWYAVNLMTNERTLINDTNSTISGATVDATGTNVVLNTSAQTQGATYTLTVNEILDRANLSVAANTTKTFRTLAEHG